MNRCKAAAGQLVIEAGSTGERPFADIVGQPRYWLIWTFWVPSIYISGFLFVSTGLAYDVFGTPRPTEYFTENRSSTPLITDRFNSLDQIIETDGSRFGA